jgi:hypothetical protein
MTEVTCPREIQKRKKREIKVCFRMEKFIQKSSKEIDVQAAQVERDAYERELVVAFKDFDPELADQEPKCECTTTCACGSVKDFIRRTEEALESSCGSKRIRKGFSRPWYDDEVKSLVETRRQAHKSYVESPKLELWQDFTKARTRCGKAIKKKKAGLWQEFLDKFDDAYKGNHKIMWNLVRRLVPSSNKISLQPIKDKNGILATSEEEIMEAWADHQSSLGTPSRHPLQDDQFTREVEEEVVRLTEEAKTQGNFKLGMEFTIEEIRAALSALDYYKAGAADGTKNPMFKCGGKTMEVMLFRLFNYLRERETFSEDWGRSEVVNLFKEGDKSDPGNYRGISLISCLGKIYLSLWAKRLADFLETKLDDEQGGFRRSRNTVDQALTLREILLQRKRSCNTTYLCFVDFRKAFDTVWHDGLWKRMWDSGVKGKPWRIIRNLYGSISSSVKVGGKTSRRVQMRQGVRQGCPLSPILFNCFINELAKRLREADCGFAAGGKDVVSLLYADDVVLMAYSAEKLQVLINVVDTFCRQWHMDINIKKSEVMVVPGGRKPPPKVKFTCREKELKEVSQYKYLGIQFTSKLDWGTHIEYALDKANKRTRSMSKLLTNSRISSRAKFLVWKAYVRPLLDYGSEVWVATKLQAEKIESAQTRAGVQGLKLNSKTSTHAVRVLMGCSSLTNRHKRSSLNYFFKVQTMKKERLVRHILKMPSGDYTKKTTWMEDVLEVIRADPHLNVGLKKIKEAQARNGGCVPVVELLVDSFGNKEEINHQELWKRRTQQWLQRQELDEIASNANAARSTLRLVARATRETSELPKWPITRKPNAGATQIRMRMLAGTSALNVTLSKFRDRNPCCPWECKGIEDPAHFYLHCEGTQDLRTKMFSRMDAACYPGTCGDRFIKIKDKEGKVALLLGAEVDGYHLDRDMDEAVAAFTTAAYSARSKRLESRYNLNQAEDLTGGIPAYFRPPVHARRQHSLPPQSPDKDDSRNSRVVGVVLYAQPPAGAGSNGLQAAERE